MKRDEAPSGSTQSSVLSPQSSVLSPKPRVAPLAGNLLEVTFLAPARRRPCGQRLHLSGCLNSGGHISAMPEASQPRSVCRASPRSGRCRARNAKGREQQGQALPRLFVPECPRHSDPRGRRPARTIRPLRLRLERSAQRAYRAARISFKYLRPVFPPRAWFARRKPVNNQAAVPTARRACFRGRGPDNVNTGRR
jgi:hypothetical protein